MWGDCIGFCELLCRTCDIISYCCYTNVDTAWGYGIRGLSGDGMSPEETKHSGRQLLHTVPPAI